MLLIMQPDFGTAMVFLVVAAIMIMSFAVATNAADISVTLNGEALVFEQAPVIVEGRTLVPLRAIFEALGAEVTWDNDTFTAIAVKDDTTIKITIDDMKLYKNDEVIELDVPARLIDGRTLVPARAVSEALQATVDWDAETRTVTVTK